LPASLVVITEEQRTPQARERQLRERRASAKASFLKELNQYEGHWQLRSLFDKYVEASERVYRYSEGRLWKAERDLRATLGADLSDVQRECVLTTLYGEQQGRRRNVHVLSEAERQLIDQYREIDAKGKQMLRELFARLAATSMKGGA
jgi:hypothetical protein